MSNPDASRDQSVLDFVRERKIPEVLHFTMKNGLLGILASEGVLSRDQLDEDKYVEHVYKANCEHRLKDADWISYVNLSISRINGRMLNVSERWPDRDGQWWAVLSFDPEMLADPGVWFTTTNNTYPSCIRAPGLAGIQNMFSPKVTWGYYDTTIYRSSQMSEFFTTDPQAEVLYPGKVPLDYLRAIYVKSGENVDEIHHFLGGLNLKLDVEITISPEVFQ
ncbi:hypothetical protein DM793_03945 [Paenarthrobacter nitroguajacolicus]|uniref:DarT ssDNA thymidine ADP-ribosyltransferase family protein n=1 Tax=Paenarthrobacter nitroguajacolicus TaxID=211146 RepID=UPI0015C02529|nr:hypothetical protein [Paenarthrobacter nitroguajacolicus]